MTNVDSLEKMQPTQLMSLLLHNLKKIISILDVASFHRDEIVNMDSTMPIIIILSNNNK